MATETTKIVKIFSFLPLLVARPRASRLKGAIGEVDALLTQKTGLIWSIKYSKIQNNISRASRARFTDFLYVITYNKPPRL